MLFTLSCPLFTSSISCPASTAVKWCCPSLSMARKRGPVVPPCVDWNCFRSSTCSVAAMGTAPAASLMICSAAPVDSIAIAAAAAAGVTDANAVSRTRRGWPLLTPDADVNVAYARARA